MEKREFFKYIHAMKLYKQLNFHHSHNYFGI